MLLEIHSTISTVVKMGGIEISLDAMQRFPDQPNDSFFGFLAALLNGSNVS